MTLKLDPMPAEGFHKNPGTYPAKLSPDTRLVVQFANGYIDKKHNYTPVQLSWKLTGFAWDVGAVALAE